MSKLDYNDRQVAMLHEQSESFRTDLDDLRQTVLHVAKDSVRVS